MVKFKRKEQHDEIKNNTNTHTIAPCSSTNQPLKWHCIIIIIASSVIKSGGGTRLHQFPINLNRNVRLDSKSNWRILGHRLLDLAGRGRLGGGGLGRGFGTLVNCAPIVVDNNVVTTPEGNGLATTSWHYCQILILLYLCYCSCRALAAIWDGRDTYGQTLLIARKVSRRWNRTSTRHHMLIPSTGCWAFTSCFRKQNTYSQLKTKGSRVHLLPRTKYITVNKLLGSTCTHSLCSRVNELE